MTNEVIPQAGVCQQIDKGMRCILAPNPSKMTHWGTNTYLIGDSDLALIDPGPDDPDHLRAILAAVAPHQRISHILVTHAHLDHSPLARPLAQQTGAKVYGYGPATAGRSPLMQRLAQEVQGGEGVDHSFAPDIPLRDGDTLQASDWSLRTLHTPGHFAGHLSFALGRRLFCGDHVMGWASSLISPPDGDMADYIQSLHRLASENWQEFLPAHGTAIADPAARLHALILHREAREAAILTALTAEPRDLNTLTRIVYHDTPEALMPAAARNCLAHLIDLASKSKISATAPLGPHARFALI